MRLTLHVLGLVAIAAIGSNAAPAEDAGSKTVLRDVETPNSVSRPLSYVHVVMYAGDTCSGDTSEFSLENGGNRCVPVPFAVRSIRAPGG